jgi:hypothetical protein
MAATLDSVVQELQTQRTENKTNSESVTEVMGDVRNRVGMSNSTLLDMVGNVRRLDRNIIAIKNAPNGMSDDLVNALVPLRIGIMTLVADTKSMLRAVTSPPPVNPDDLETARDDASYKSNVLKLLTEIRDRSSSGNSNDDDDEPSNSPRRSGGALGVLIGPAATLAVILGSLAGAAAGITKPLRMMAGAVGRLLKSMSPQFIKDFAKRIKTFAVDMGKRARDVFVAFVTTVKSTASMIGNTIKAVVVESKLGQTVSRVKDGFKSLAAPFKTLGDTLGRGKGMLSGIVQPFQKFGGFFKSFVGTIGAVFKIVGKLFAPLSAIIIIGKNIVSDLMSGDFGFGTIKNIIDDLIKFFVTDLLDLIKGAFAWIAEKLGFDGIAESLNSFSFSGLYQKLSDTISDTIGGFFDAFKDEGGKLNFGKMIGFVLQKFISVATSIPRAILRGLATAAEEYLPDFLSSKVADGLRGMEGKLDKAFGIDADVSGAIAARKSARAAELNEATQESDELKRTAGNVTIMDNSQKNTVSGGGGGGSPSLGTSSATDAHDPATSHI